MCDGFCFLFVLERDVGEHCFTDGESGDVGVLSSSSSFSFE